MMQRILVILLLTSCAHVVLGGDADDPTPPINGAPECPCLASSSSPLNAQAAAALVRLGYPADYGQKGCKQYDLKSAKEGCNSANPPEHCSSAWCYVDTEKCPINATKCAEAGGHPGQDILPYCRTREHKRSRVLMGQIGDQVICVQGVCRSATMPYYSYTTCGALDTYKPFVAVDGKYTLKVSVPSDDYVPWVMKGSLDTAMPHWKGYRGLLPDALEAAKNDLGVDLTLRDYFASAQSKAVFPASSFSACILDVKVGKLDACVGNFWVTSERLAIINFVQPFAEDRLYLVASSETVPPSFVDHMHKPFAPFEPLLWLLVFGYITFTSVVTFVIDGKALASEEDMNPHPVARYCMASYLSWFGVFSGGPQNGPVSFPGRFAQLGYGFFIMVLLASYTANLATILVTNSQRTGIQSIQDAIDKQLTICVLSAVQPELTAKYPQAKLAGFDLDRRIWRELQKGSCGAAIMSVEAIDDGMSGQANKWDCAQYDAKSSTAFSAKSGDGEVVLQASAVTACQKDSSGAPTLNRDCKMFQRVGDLLLSIPLSFPVNEEYVSSISYRFRAYKASGKFETIAQKYVDALPVSACSSTGKRRHFNGRREMSDVKQGRRKAVSSSAGVSVVAMHDVDNKPPSLALDVESMYGTIVVAFCAQVVALMLWAIEKGCGKSLSEIVGFTAPSGDANSEEEAVKGTNLASGRESDHNGNGCTTEARASGELMFQDQARRSESTHGLHVRDKPPAVASAQEGPQSSGMSQISSPYGFIIPPGSRKSSSISVPRYVDTASGLSPLGGPEDTRTQWIARRITSPRSRLDASPVRTETPEQGAQCPGAAGEGFKSDHPQPVRDERTGSVDVAGSDFGSPLNTTSAIPMVQEDVIDIKTTLKLLMQRQESHHQAIHHFMAQVGGYHQAFHVSD